MMFKPLSDHVLNLVSWEALIRENVVIFMRYVELKM
jgi:hypothetical protein